MCSCCTRQMHMIHMRREENHFAKAVRTLECYQHCECLRYCQVRRSSDHQPAKSRTQCRAVPGEHAKQNTKSLAPPLLVPLSTSPQASVELKILFCQDL